MSQTSYIVIEYQFVNNKIWKNPISLKTWSIVFAVNMHPVTKLKVTQIKIEVYIYIFFFECLS
jgi:hypothetical protein